MARKPKKIGLFHHVGGGNLGDDATVDAVMNGIKSRWPDAEIFGFSMNPVDTEARHNITSYPIRRETWAIENERDEHRSALKSKIASSLNKSRIGRLLFRAIKGTISRLRTSVEETWFLAKSFQIIRSFDLLIITGGGGLVDSWGGPWKFPYTLFKWTALAKMSGAKCYVLNMGAGPITRPMGKWFITRTLLMADYVSFRDDESQRLVQKVGYKAESHLHPDSAYSLEIPATIASENGDERESIVGMSPMSYCDPRRWYEKDQDTYDFLIHTLAPLGSWLVQNQHPLGIFSTDTQFDLGAIEDLKMVLRRDFGRANPPWVRQEPVTTVEELLAQISSMDYIVTCRFHGVIFAHLMNKPVLAIAHHPKVTKLMDDLGLSKYCINIHQYDLDLLTTTFQCMVNDRDEIKSRMAERLSSFKSDLKLQFDTLFPREAQV